MNPAVDNEQVGKADLEVQPEGTASRIGHNAKALVAAGIGIAEILFLVITGEEPDPEVLAGIQTVIVSLLVWAVRNR